MVGGHEIKIGPVIGIQGHDVVDRFAGRQLEGPLTGRRHVWSESHLRSTSVVALQNGRSGAATMSQRPFGNEAPPCHLTGRTIEKVGLEVPTFSLGDAPHE